MTRIKAAASHLLISITLSTLVICLLMFGWYPLPYFWALGGSMLLILIVGIDVVLGPLMTLILFNPKKSWRALTLDLTLIAILQIAALSYGIYSGSVSRLVFTVFDGHSFQLVQAGDIAGDFLKKAHFVEYQSRPLIGHRYAGLQLGDDPQIQSDISFFAALGVGPQALPQYYVPLTQARAQLLTAAIPVTRLEQKNPALMQQIAALLTARELAWTDVVIIPVNARTQIFTAVVALNPVQVIKVVAANPG